MAAKKRAKRRAKKSSHRKSKITKVMVHKHEPAISKVFTHDIRALKKRVDKIENIVEKTGMEDYYGGK
jgi:tetrahydromethanopterin S-methyltransferase subunit G